MIHHLVAPIVQLGRHEHVGHDIHVLDFVVAEHERNGHQVLEPVELPRSLAHHVAFSVLDLLRLGCGLLGRRVLQGREQFLFLDGTHQLVYNLAVAHHEERRERLDRQARLDFVDARFVDAHRRNLDVGVILRDADECRDHDEARRAARRSDIQDDRLLGLQNLFLEVGVVHLDNLDVFGRE